MDDKHTTTSSPGIIANGVGYDPTDINAPGVTIFTAVVVGVILAVFFGVTLYFEKFYNDLSRQRIDAAPTQDLALIRSREETELNTYKVLDKQKGVVRIPVEQAMKALLEEVPAGKGYSTKDQAIKVEPAPGAPAPAGAAAAPAAAAAKPAAPAPAPAAKKK